MRSVLADGACTQASANDARRFERVAYHDCGFVVMLGGHDVCPLE